jgi:hypothetical protein
MGGSPRAAAVDQSVAMAFCTPVTATLPAQIACPLLVEIKTGPVTSDGVLNEAYDQLIDYYELVPAAGYPVSALGLYLARYGLLLTWPATRHQKQRVPARGRGAG